MVNYDFGDKYISTKTKKNTLVSKAKQVSQGIVWLYQGIDMVIIIYLYIRFLIHETKWRVTMSRWVLVKPSYYSEIPVKCTDI